MGEGDVNLIAKIAPKNEAFVVIVDGANTGLNTTNFDKNLSSADDTVQKAMETLDNLSVIGSDEKVKYDSSDPTAGYVADKIIAGTGISVAEGTGADENKLVVSNSDAGSSAVSTHEATYDHDLIATALQSETDPVFSASEAANITATDITNLGNLSGTNSGDQSSSDFNLSDLDDVVDTDKAEGKILKVNSEGNHIYVTDPDSIHLDQSTPQTFTDGDVTGTGLLRVDDGVLGLDSTSYTLPFTNNYFIEKTGNIFLNAGVSGGVASGLVRVSNDFAIDGKILDDTLSPAVIDGNLDYVVVGAGDFVGQAGDKLNINMNGTWYEDIDLSAVTSLAGVYIPIFNAIGSQHVWIESGQLRVSSRVFNTTTAVSYDAYVEIAEGTNTTQPVLARLGFGTGITKSAKYVLGRPSIDTINRKLYTTNGGTPFDWSSDDELKMTPNGDKPEMYVKIECNTGFSYYPRLTLWQVNDEAPAYSNMSIGVISDVGFGMITSYAEDQPKMGIAPNVGSGGDYVDNMLIVEDLGYDQESNSLGVRIAGYQNNPQTPIPLEVILTSPDGTQWILTVDNSGNLGTTSLY